MDPAKMYNPMDTTTLNILHDSAKYTHSYVFYSYLR